MKTLDSTVVQNIRTVAHPVTGAAQDYDRLLDRIGNSKFVLIGEASHGTHEFYQQRGDHETPDSGKGIYRGGR